MVKWFIKDFQFKIIDAHRSLVCFVKDVPRIPVKRDYKDF